MEGGGTEGACVSTKMQSSEDTSYVDCTVFRRNQ